MKTLLLAFAVLLFFAGCKDEAKPAAAPAAPPAAPSPAAPATPAPAAPAAPAPTPAAKPEDKVNELRRRSVEYVEHIRAELKKLYLSLARAIEDDNRAEFDSRAERLCSESERLSADATPLEKEIADFAARRTGECRSALTDARALFSSLNTDEKFKKMQFELPGRKLGRFAAIDGGDLVVTFAGSGETHRYSLSNRPVSRELAVRAARASGMPGARFYLELRYGSPDDKLVEYAPDDLWREIYPLIAADLRKSDEEDKNRAVRADLYRFEDLDKMIANGQTEAFRKAVANQAVLTGVDAGGRTLLMAAVREKNPDIAAILLQNGAPVDAVTIDGRTALAMAVQADHYQLVQLLLDSSANANFKNPVTGKRIIELAPSKEIKALLKAYGAKE